ncbi:MAG: SPOR domain-containing protein [Gammaproteobacteria bacterium]|jgi:DedD protein|nr:SPOR domain-containing protein [Gammaproteobacteria bacterium]MDH3954126.1 SPOR domain-containing protein [Gammaproteobacteria bacterium]
MDRALKERIIGAAVLVVFVVLVVPVFLDGPPDNGEIVSERVPLPGQAAEGETRTVVLERDRDEPVPAAAVEPETRRPQPAQTGAAEQPESKPEPDPAPETEPQPAPAKPATQPAATAAESPTGMWAVQLGSFGNEQNAERLAADLRKQGFAAFLSQLSKDSGQLHRVRIGPQKDRESAEAMAERLAKAGHKGQVVPHP